MKACIKCGKIIKDNEQFCNQCGGKSFRPVQNQQMPNKPMTGQPSNMQAMGGQGHVQMNGATRPNPNSMNRQQQIQQAQMQAQMQNQMQNQMQTKTSKKPLFKSKADKQAEMEMMRQMQMNNKQNTQNSMQKNSQPMQNNNQYGGQQNNPYSDDPIDMSVKDWIITLVYLVIPIWNIIYVVKTFKDPYVPFYKKDFVKAYIIYFAAALVISLIAALIITLM